MTVRKRRKIKKIINLIFSIIEKSTHILIAKIRDKLMNKKANKTRNKNAIYNKSSMR